MANIHAGLHSILHFRMLVINRSPYLSSPSHQETGELVFVELGDCPNGDLPQTLRTALAHLKVREQIPHATETLLLYYFVHLPSPTHPTHSFRHRPPSVKNPE